MPTIHRERKVLTHLEPAHRRCLYCLGDGPSTRDEHVVQRRFGRQADNFVIAPGGVCDECNSWLGRQVDAPFTERFDIDLTRRIEGMRGRGRETLRIEGQNVTALLKVEIGGAVVEIEASSAVQTADGGLDIEVRPKQQPPDDLVSRTIRGLWKISLGTIYLHDQAEALDPKWDHLRLAVLGRDFSGFLLQRPFVVSVTRSLDVNVDLAHDTEATAITFAFGGVTMATALRPGQQFSSNHFLNAGWSVHSTTDKPRRVEYLRMDPTRE